MFHKQYKNQKRIVRKTVIIDKEFEKIFNKFRLISHRLKSLTIMFNINDKLLFFRFFLKHLENELLKKCS